MSEQPKYFDTNGDLWQKAWEAADDYESYLQTDPEKAGKWHEAAGRLPALTAAQVERLTAASCMCWSPAAAGAGTAPGRCRC